MKNNFFIINKDFFKKYTNENIKMKNSKKKS
jgi:hypothetical protein